MKIGEVRLVVKNLCRTDSVRNVSFHVRRGEVVALTGLVGAGRTETARLIFGADRRDEGEVHLDARQLCLRKPRDAQLEPPSRESKKGAPDVSPPAPDNKDSDRDRTREPERQLAGLHDRVRKRYPIPADLVQRVQRKTKRKAN